MVNRTCFAFVLTVASSLAYADPFRVNLPPPPPRTGTFSGVNDVHVIFNEDINSLIFVSDSFPKPGQGFKKGAKSIDIFWDDPILDADVKLFFEVGTTNSATLTVASAYWTLHVPPKPGEQYVPDPGNKIQDIVPTSITVTPVPEPATMAALAASLFLLVRRKR